MYTVNNWLSSNFKFQLERVSRFKNPGDMVIIFSRCFLKMDSVINPPSQRKQPITCHYMDPLRHEFVCLILFGGGEGGGESRGLFRRLRREEK